MESDEKMNDREREKAQERVRIYMRKFIFVHNSQFESKKDKLMQQSVSLTINI